MMRKSFEGKRSLLFPGGFRRIFGDPTQRDRPHDGFGAAAGLEFVKNMGEMPLHRPITDVELHGNGLIGEAPGAQPQHIHFPFGEFLVTGG